MRKEYFAKSMTFSKLPECFEKLCKSVKFKNAELYKGLTPKKIEAEGVDALKELNESDLPIIIKFIKDESEPKIHFQTRSDDIQEVRVKSGAEAYRLLGFFDGSNLVVLDYAFQKKTQKTPQNAIKTAEGRKRDYFKRRMGNE